MQASSLTLNNFYQIVSDLSFKLHNWQPLTVLSAMQGSWPRLGWLFSVFHKKPLGNKKRPLGHKNLKSLFFGRTEKKTLSLHAQKSKKDKHDKGCSLLSQLQLSYSAQLLPLQHQNAFVTSTIFRCKSFKMIVVTKRFMCDLKCFD